MKESNYIEINKEFLFTVLYIIIICTLSIGIIYSLYSQITDKAYNEGYDEGYDDLFDKMFEKYERNGYINLIDDRHDYSIVCNYTEEKK